MDTHANERQKYFKETSAEQNSADSTHWLWLPLSAGRFGTV